MGRARGYGGNPSERSSKAVENLHVLCCCCCVCVCACVRVRERERCACARLALTPAPPPPSTRIPDCPRALLFLAPTSRPRQSPTWTSTTCSWWRRSSGRTCTRCRSRRCMVQTSWYVCACVGRLGAVPDASVVALCCGVRGPRALVCVQRPPLGARAFALFPAPVELVPLALCALCCATPPPPWITPPPTGLPVW